jgi:uncharacterized protein YneR
MSIESADKEPSKGNEKEDKIVSFVDDEAFWYCDDRVDTDALQSIAELGVTEVEKEQDFRVARN